MLNVAACKCWLVYEGRTNTTLPQGISTNKACASLQGTPPRLGLISLWGIVRVGHGQKPLTQLVVFDFEPNFRNYNVNISTRRCHIRNLRDILRRNRSYQVPEQ